MQVASLLIVGTAKLEGDLSAKQSEFVAHIQSLIAPSVKGQGTWQ